MQTIALPADVRSSVRQQRRNGKQIGVVPTMGALHQGHVSLIEAAAQQCDYVVTTIFVNPTQFGPNEDFNKYPRTLEQDFAKCEAAGADLVFLPEVDVMYPPGCQTCVTMSGLTDVLEGAHRPGHFDGVTTVVAKLLHITEPDKAFFGQKDYQQQLVIRQMVEDLNWGLEIVTCPTVREPDGLAMSSRNRYLSASERSTALHISAALNQANAESKDNKATPANVQESMIKQLTKVDGLKLDYAIIVNSKTLQCLSDDTSTNSTGFESAVALIAAKVGTTRLIDNQILAFRSHNQTR